ncbi:MAG TPA: DUF3631 domain-containing protein [Verrucomicrobiae bacterium]|nr:DUF3631 domain-containing protein [Verrucomicrobiae bacterium]
MKTKPIKKPLPASSVQPPETPPRRYPKYYLEDVLHPLRARVLDLCIRRLYHDALELLHTHHFRDYTQDDLISFYHWAPLTLPGQEPCRPERPRVPRDYDQPSPEQINDICERLAGLSSDLTERVHHALRHDPIDVAASLLWKAGLGFTSAELYEFRKTLFPPNSLVDAYTSGPPVLRTIAPDRGCGKAQPQHDQPPPALKPKPVTPLVTPTSTSASPSDLRPSVSDSQPSPATDNGPLTIQNPSPSIVDPTSSITHPPSSDASGEIHSSNHPPIHAATSRDELHEHRQRLVALLAGRATSPVPKPKPQASEPKPKASPTTHSGSLITDNDVTTDPGPILSDLRDLISRHIVLPEMAAETLALWVIHTYAFTLRQVTTYIGVISPEKRCGKTTLLELLGRLANRSLTASNISPSALFKVIQETSPTLLIDEADTFLHGRDELAGILNAGYRKDNAYVLRVSDRNSGGRVSLQAAEFGQWANRRADGSYSAIDFAQYSCWCPKVMAAIGRLPDTLADRCIIITMQRKLPGERCERLRQLNAVEFRKRCAAFVHQHRDAIASARPDIPSALNDRAADIWEPLLAIADLASGDWPAIARQAALKLSAADKDELTLIGYFLRDIRALMLAANADRILSRDIIATLNPRHDRAWEDLRRGREINEYWLAGRMRELGIRPKYFRHGDSSARGYMLADVESAFRRYVPNPDAHANIPLNFTQL